MRFSQSVFLRSSWRFEIDVFSLFIIHKQTKITMRSSYSFIPITALRPPSVFVVIAPLSILLVGVGYTWLSAWLLMVAEDTPPSAKLIIRSSAKLDNSINISVGGRESSFSREETVESAAPDLSNNLTGRGCEIAWLMSFPNSVRVHFAILRRDFQRFSCRLELE